MIKDTEYLGDCRTILDSPECPFYDATEMAIAIEESQPLDYFYCLALHRILKCYLISFGRYGNVAWAYNGENDIHYFFEVA
jgi:hypothetical protein